MSRAHAKAQAAALRAAGLDEYALNRLALYNGEVARGLVHTEEWKAKMTELQQRYDLYRALYADKRGWKVEI